MPNRHCIIALTVVLTTGLPAFAADTSATSPAFANPAFANPDTPGILDGKPASGVPNIVDTIFLQQLSIGGRAEVALGKLADERSSTAAIDHFGRMMVKDHTDANGKLVSLARSAKVELPPDLDAEHIAARGELDALRGPAFDIRYVEIQIKDHQKAAQLLIHEIGSGQHSGTRQFAADTLPGIMSHLEMAKTLHAGLTGAGPPPQAAPPPARQ
jgi:putative membrane protein